jgi:hypothetical protein
MPSTTTTDTSLLPAGWAPGPWVTPDAPSVDGTIRLDDVREGDLVFCARPGFLQDLCTRAGEPWRHVGLTVADPTGDLHIAEVSGARFGLRSLAAIMARYEAMAVGRVAGPHQAAAARAARWSATQAGRPQVYAWDDLILAGILAVTRCRLLPEQEPALERVLRAAATALTRLPAEPGDSSYTCSSFIAAALTDAGVPCRLPLAVSRCGPGRPTLTDLVRRRQRPLRAGAGDHIHRDQLVALTRALLLAAVAATTGLTGPAEIDEVTRWVTPGDLWRADLLANRWYLGSGPT